MLFWLQQLIHYGVWFVMSINSYHQVQSQLIRGAILGFLIIAGMASQSYAQTTPGAGLLRYVPAEQNAVVFLKPAQVMASPLYASLKADPNFRPVHNQIAAIEAATGLNARRDISEILWSGAMAQPEQRFVVVARGRFQQAALIQRFKSASGYQASAYKERAVHTWRDKQSGRQMHATFPADDMLIVSDHALTLRFAITAGLDSSTSIQKFAQTRNLATRIAPQSAIWFMGLRHGVMPPEVHQNPMLNNLQGLVCGASLAERIDMNMHGELPNADLAQQYRVMLEGMIAMTRYMGEDPVLKSLAGRAAVSQGGTGVAVKLSASNEEAITLLRNAMQASAE